jgi:tetratricopeptide (TPR) repeat protein
MPASPTAPMPALPALVTILLLAAGPVLPAPVPATAQDAPADDDPRALLGQAVAAQQSGQAEEAAALYERVIQLVGPDPRILSNLAAAYSSLGRFDDAIARYRAALERDPGNGAIRLNLAFALYKSGHVAPAAEEAARVVTADPTNRSATLFLADCDLRLGRSADVVSLLDPRITDFGDDQAFSYLLGMALLAEGETERAQLLIDRVLRTDSPQAHVMLAQMHLQRGDCDAALAELDEARAANPRLPTEGFLRGQCLMEKNDWPGAEAAFRDELAVDPNHFESHLILATLLLEGGRKEEALEHAERALALRPEEPAAQLALGRLRLALGDPAAALPLLEAAGQAFPDDKKTHLQLALAYFRLGRPEDAARQREIVERIEKATQARASSSMHGEFDQTTGAAPEGSPPPQ